MLNKLIKSNFKKDLSHMVTFFLIMTLAVFMLHTGLAVLLGYSTLHQDKKKQYNFADLMVESALKPEDKAKIEEIIAGADYIDSYEKVYPVVKQFSVTKEDSDEESKDMYDLSTYSLEILPYGEYGDIEAPHFVELSDEEYENPIYVSYFYNTNLLKAELGDSVDMKVGDKYYTFQVAGFYESLLSSEYGINYVSPSLYNEWKAEQYNEMMEAQQKEEAATDDEENGVAAETSSADEPKYTMTVFYMKLAPGVNSKDAVGQLTKAFSEQEINAYAAGVDNTINDFTYMQNMIAALLSAFAIVITVIAMIIIYFRISNSIEQSIESIGALKALGYTSRQIRLSMILEFAITTSIAVLVGVGASYLVIPKFEKMIRSFSGVAWDCAFDITAFMITFILIVGTVVLVAFISTRLIKKLEPVIALRFGVSDQSFKKNHAPIEKTKGPLTWIMALKSVLGNTKQNIILFVVMVSIGIFTTFSTFLAYNCVYDPSHLYRMLNLVAADVDLQFEEDMSPVGEIEAIPEVENAWWTKTIEVTVESYSAYAVITDDWSAIPEVNIFKGRSPKYDNEIAIGGNLADSVGVTIGDEVKVNFGQQEKTYIITGIEQSAAYNGMDISLTSEGAEHLGYKATKNSIGIFVKGHSLADTRKVVSEVQDIYGDKLVRYGNAIETLKNGEQEVVAIAAGMVFAMVIVSVLVIILSLNLLVKTMIIKKQKEIGIKKALGFSSGQLRLELELSMLPQITIGAIGGAVLGSLWSNKILATLLSAMGIMRSNMEMFPWMGLVSVVFSMIVSFIIIWIISRRIKHISAYSLITE